MKEKDIAERTLEAHNDVFADIVNGLLFKGVQVVGESELADEITSSVYKSSGGLHEQNRDVAKFWNNNSVRIAMLGVENQTQQDPDMPLRVISYDGAAYRKQLLENRRSRRYPVVTLVLYFGKSRWKKNRSLLETVDVDERLKPYVNDYRLNLFQISYLSEEQVNYFKGDFRIIADFFVQKRTNKDYNPPKCVIKHVEEVLQLLRVISSDNRFDVEYLFSRPIKKGEKITMCKIMDAAINKGVKIGIEKGEKRGEKKGELGLLSRLIKKGRLTLQQAAEEVGMTPEKLELALKKLNNNSKKVATAK